MPLPTPKEKEPLREFISRCMSDPVMNKEYKERDQRVAVCRTQFDRKYKDAK